LPGCIVEIEHETALFLPMLGTADMRVPRKSKLAERGHQTLVCGSIRPVVLSHAVRIPGGDEYAPRGLVQFEQPVEFRVTLADSHSDFGTGDQHVVRGEVGAA
jgi:hypothetical protein